MQKRRLGRSDLEVTVVGLGTMTWGQQNTEIEAHAQLDLAIDHGVNLVDVAEMYPVPPMAQTAGRTETYVGSWLARTKRRDEIVLATKITGPSRGFSWIRDGGTRFTWQHLVAACEGSLQRLQTDVIDLYQLHWPDRSTAMFGALEYVHNPNEEATPIHETLEALQRLVDSGKVRYIGVSNETPWGVMRFLAEADRAGLPRIQSVQNAYSLLNRSFEIGLAEVAHREDVPLLAYSPLGMGVLSGKYEGGRTWPEGARLTQFQRFKRYVTEVGLAASERYVDIAQRHGLQPDQMALAWCHTRPFLASTLIGATTLAQLRRNLASAEVVLTDEVIRELEAVHRASPNPCP